MVKEQEQRQEKQKGACRKQANACVNKTQILRKEITAMTFETVYEISKIMPARNICVCTYVCVCV